MISASSQQSLFGTACRAAAAVLVLLAVGCKSGSSWTAKPSWWSFGGDDPAKLASAPPAPGDVAKPSSTAKPYPTTSTPEGYVLENAQRSGDAPAVAASPVVTSPATPPAVVTYGAKPAQPPALAATSPAAPPAADQPSGLSSISPQVGPYAAPPATPPVSDQPLPTTAASFATAPPAEPAMAAVPPTAAIDSRFGGAGPRVADARGSDAWSQPPAAAPAATDSRYSAGGGSRFSNASAAPPTSPAMPFPPPSGAEPLPGAVPPPAAMPVPVPAAVPAVVPAAPPSAAPPMPTKRADPGYRPGGTSSYRPSRTILAGDDSAAGSVTPVSYEAPASP
jgi:hypothetical protein